MGDLLLRFCSLFILDLSNEMSRFIYGHLTKTYLQPREYFAI